MMPVKPVQARDIMSTKLITVRPQDDVFESISILIKNNISGAPVVDQDRNLLGVFSEKSVMRVLLDGAYEGLPTNEVRAFMDTSPHTITEDTQLLSIAQIFLTTPRRRLPVLDGTRLVGQVSRRDVVRAVYDASRKFDTNDKVLLYLSALRPIDEAPNFDGEPKR
ncbi:MAG TPA: CBS domain-containing protein [Pirellulaceae bacterium]|nr:CBS domain-containing protein [Pirellulaceae bacterium]HMP68678.1 CBS domain-containing protein [Pirellulaceae bacterium]